MDPVRLDLATGPTFMHHHSVALILVDFWDVKGEYEYIARAEIGKTCVKILTVRLSGSLLSELIWHIDSARRWPTNLANFIRSKSLVHDLRVSQFLRASVM
jgi:hypothetical protein